MRMGLNWVYTNYTPYLIVLYPCLRVVENPLKDIDDKVNEKKSLNKS
jgi:hypothetical protein